jgi:hypothetical protein
MKRWPWRRVAFLVGGTVVGALGAAVPFLAPVLAPISKALLVAGAASVGVAVRTPGHHPAKVRTEGPTQS